MSVRQILKVYRSATADEIDHGMNWYAIAKRDATKIAKEFGVSVAYQFMPCSISSAVAER